MNGMKGSSSETREAILCFQFSERIKSELIIASKLLGMIEGLKGDELRGAKKLMESFLDALLGEIQIAKSILGLRDFDEGSLRVQEAQERISRDEFLEATKCISEAISFTTTIGQRAMQTLIQEKLL